MKIKKIGIIGLGHVGEAVIKSLKKYSALINRRVPLKIVVKSVSDKDKSKAKIAKRLGCSFTLNSQELIDDPEIDIIVELMGGIKPAGDFIEDALNKGKDVVTANKALLATSGKQLFSLAKRKNRSIGFEASVCGAIPIIRSISQGLVSCEVKKIYGILNGTTNYILYKMAKENIDFKQALKQAQDNGLAEKSPYLDIEGKDALHKLCILSYLCYGVWPLPNKIYTEGISKISLLDILYAQELKYQIKLLAIAKKENNFLDLRVQPTLVSIDHPLSHVSLAYNAVYLHTQPAGELFFRGEGAGGVPTSSAVISDIVSIALGKGMAIRDEEKTVIQNIKDVRARYYIRFMAQDHPGVLAKISKILASLKISIASVTQKERNKGRAVPIIMLTDEVREDSVRKAIDKIDSLGVIKGPSQKIRIEDL
ncbi:MAG: homoserine dehydrogenase [Candidatus Susulua stagnicola]|nr:homoserine dehydrogenase [Candidatus Susulua stagnicola]